MNTYTDPKLLDVAGAMEALPALPLSVQGGQVGVTIVGLRATGTENAVAERIDARTVRPNVTPMTTVNSTTSPLVPVLVPTTGKTCILGSILDKVTAESGRNESTAAVAVSACAVNKKDPLTTAVNGSRSVERRRVELPTSALRINRNRTEFSTLNRIVVGLYHDVRSLASSCEQPSRFAGNARISARTRVNGPRQNLPRKKRRGRLSSNGTVDTYAMVGYNMFGREVPGSAPLGKLRCLPSRPLLWSAKHVEKRAVQRAA